MDVLLASLLKQMKAAGYRRFSLGMAPWAEVGAAPDAPLRERAIGTVTHYLNRFFSIEGCGLQIEISARLGTSVSRL